MTEIRFDHISKRYAEVVAVDDLNLTIRDKEFLVLLGPSGCGKSTTLNMCAGLEEVSEGNLYFDDRLVNFIPPHERDVAMVFQSYALYPHKSVYDNIAFGLRMRNFPRHEIDQRVKSAAERLAITELLHRRPEQLSGGQRQRVALGRAIVRDPSVFLMDEPLSNLDAALRISMRAEIKQLHETMDTTFVYVTHDQAEALTLADRIVVMKEGLVQQIGTSEDVYDRPVNTFVASFLGNPPINYLEGRLEWSGDHVRFRTATQSLGFPPELSKRLEAHLNRTVRLGLRPEDVNERFTAEEERISGAVTSVLPVGSDVYLSASVDDEELFFRVGKQLHPRVGENVALAVNIERLHVFDPTSGASLLWQDR